MSKFNKERELNLRGSLLSNWLYVTRLKLGGGKLVRENGRLIVVRFARQGETFEAGASTSKVSVWNCHGSTKKQAEEMALFRIRQLLNKRPEICNKAVAEDGYTYFFEDLLE